MIQRMIHSTLPDTLHNYLVTFLRFKLTLALVIQMSRPYFLNPSVAVSLDVIHNEGGKFPTKT